MRRVAVANGLPHGGPKPVGSVVGKVEEEWLVAILFDEAGAVLGPKVSEIARLAPDGAVLDNLLTVEARTCAVGHGDPITEAFLGTQVVAEMPLADQARGVAGIDEKAGNRIELGESVVRVGADLGSAGAQIPMDAVLRRHQARQQRRTSR